MSEARFHTNPEGSRLQDQQGWQKLLAGQPFHRTVVAVSKYEDLYLNGVETMRQAEEGIIAVPESLWCFRNKQI
jgi:hypothetical protein